MLSTKRTVKNKLNNNYIVGMIFVLLSLLAAVSALGILTNPLGLAFNKFQQYLFGAGVFLFPIMLLIFGIKFVSGNIKWLDMKTICLFLLFVLCLLGTAHNIFVPNGEELFPDKLLLGGGFIGGLFILILHRTIGVTGSWLLLVFGWLLILYYAVPFKNIYNFIFNDEKIEDYGGSDVEVKTKRDLTKNRINKYNHDFENYRRTADKNIYKSEEFAAFTEGITPEPSFKKILNFKSPSAYKKQELQQIKQDPVQIPEWEEQKKTVVVRPIIDYEKKKPSLGGDTVIHDTVTQEIPASEKQQSEEHSFTAPVPPQKTEQHDAILIVDSAEKAVNGITEEHEDKNDTLAENVNYHFPTVNLLDIPKITSPVSYESDIMQQCSVLEQTLADFKVKASVIAVTRGPSVTRFELQPAPGVKVSSVVNLADDIALKLAASGVRIEAPIPGKAAIGIEVPNVKNDPVFFREVVDNDAVHNSESKLCIGLGKDISGNIITADLSKMPHLLVAGSTGSGKSVCINTIIAGILYKASPDDVKLILVDPKVVELSNYNGIPHLLTPVVTDAKKAASALHWAVAEMERRYQLFADNHVREINSYNQKADEKMPFIVIIIDELSDLMMVAKVDVEEAILRLAQKARAAGIHLILATQRPSVDVITGIVKANIPSRIAFAVSSQTDSRTILDMGGAEKLLGKGDMLFYPIGFNKPVRVQGAFVSDAELNRITEFITQQSIPLNYSDEVTSQALECEAKGNASSAESAPSSNVICDDELFEDAVQLVLDMGQASSSMLQRRFRIGYTRAARLVDIMEELGIVGQSAGSKPREVILSRQEVEERFFKHE